MGWSYMRRASGKPLASAARTTDGHESYLPKRGKSETERDSGTSTYSGTYSYERERERLPERKRDDWGEREPSCAEEEDTEPSLSDQRLRRPKPLRSSSRKRSLIRLV